MNLFSGCSSIFIWEWLVRVAKNKIKKTLCYGCVVYIINVEISFYICPNHLGLHHMFSTFVFWFVK
jgi:hypothetical protein